MSPSEFSIREKIKYEEEWNWEETRTWMEEAHHASVQYFGRQEEDYKSYKKDVYPALEQLIAVNIFGITQSFCTRAHSGTNLLDYFSDNQRKQAIELREEMEKISGGNDAIQMQVVCIPVRLNDDLQRKNVDSKNENKRTGKIIVFRVKDSKGNPIFFDCNLKRYDSWEDYLTGNTLPHCIMCYPKDGFLTKEVEENGSKKFVPNDVEFGEPPSCKLPECPDANIRIYHNPSNAINYFSSKPSRSLIAWALSAALTEDFQQLPERRSTIKSTKRENYGATLMADIINFENVIINRRLSKYLDELAKDGRSPTTLESVIITGFLTGLPASQVASFSWMTWSLSWKPKLKPIDIVGYAVVCQNLYSICISPWIAKEFLTNVRNNRQAEISKNIKKRREEMTWEKSKIAANQTKLADLKKIEEDSAVIEQLERDIEAGEARLRGLEGKIFSYQTAFLNNLGKWMTDEGANKSFIEFRDNAMKDANQLGANTTIDQNDRIIKAVTYMDAEMVFKMVSKTNSRIQFANDETVDLLINSQLEVHPRAINQMNEISETTNKNNLEHMMELTKSCAESKKGLPEGFFADIRKCLKDYQMMTRTDIAKVKDMISARTKNRTIIRHFVDMTQRESYRMRTVLEQAVNQSLDLAYKMAEYYGDTSIFTIAAFVEVVQLEVRALQNPINMSAEEERKRRTQYHKVVRDAERSHLQRSGKPLAEAKDISFANFQSRENIEDAKLKGDDVDMYQIMKDNPLDNSCKNVYKKGFAEWNEDCTVKQQKHTFFEDLRNIDRFKTKMEEIINGINRARTNSQREYPTMENPVAAYYHVRKHGELSRRTFNKVYGWKTPKDQGEQKYFKEEKNIIFQGRNKQRTTISQDATNTSTTYFDKESGCFGVTKTKYNAERGVEYGKTEVATHFFKKNYSKRAPAAPKQGRQWQPKKNAPQLEQASVPQLQNNKKTRQARINATPSLIPNGVRQTGKKRNMAIQPAQSCSNGRSNQNQRQNGTHE